MFGVVPAFRIRPTETGAAGSAGHARGPMALLSLETGLAAPHVPVRARSAAAGIWPCPHQLVNPPRDMRPADQAKGSRSDNGELDTCVRSPGMGRDVSEQAGRSR